MKYLPRLTSKIKPINLKSGANKMTVLTISALENMTLKELYALAQRI